MNNRLEDRIVEFSKSLDRMHHLERVGAIQRFIEGELASRDVPYTLRDTDLADIRSYAVQENLSSTGNNKSSDSLAQWWTLAVCSWLRSKSMLFFIIGGQKGEPDDSKPGAKR